MATSSQFDVAMNGGCPGVKPWAVINRQSGVIMGCFASQVEANDYQAALLAMEADVKRPLHAPEAPPGGGPV